MNINKTCTVVKSILAILVLSTSTGLNAQGMVSSDVMDAAQRLPAEMVTFADTVLYNGHIVSMDDADINTSPGTIAQAMAIHDGEEP